MLRKTFLQRLAMIGGAIVLIPSGLLNSCTYKPEPLKNIEDIDPALLDEIGETIIPATPGVPGAKATGIGAYMITMLKDCFREEQQKLCIEGLNNLNRKCAARYHTPFIELNPDQKNELLRGLQEEALNSGEKHYFDILKGLTLNGYFSSEIGMTEARAYEPIPGRYISCMPLKKGQKPWAV